jgi:hypothetical protein
LGDSALWLSRLDSQKDSQNDCFLTGQSEVQKNSPAALARKRRFLRILDMVARVFPAEFRESGAASQ